MASSTTWIVDRKDTRRMCITKGSNAGRKCLFHCWSTESRVLEPSLLKGGHNGGTYSEIFGVLEFEDGHLEKLRTGEFDFVDGGQFKQWAWPGEE